MDVSLEVGIFQYSKFYGKLADIRTQHYGQSQYVGISKALGPNYFRHKKHTLDSREIKYFFFVLIFGYSAALFAFLIEKICSPNFCWRRDIFELLLRHLERLLGHLKRLMMQCLTPLKMFKGIKLFKLKKGKR